MNAKWRLVLLAATVLCAVAAALASCAGERGAIIVALQTDVAVPKDIDGVGLSVSVGGVVKYSSVFGLSPDGRVDLPATIALIEPDTSSATVDIRAIAFSGGTARAIRDIVTTVPHARIALLRLPLSFLSVDDGDMGAVSLSQIDRAPTPPPQDPSAGVDLTLPFNSQCSRTMGGKTTIDGTCTDDALDSSTLPTYNEADIFPNGKDAPQPCFDPIACFAAVTVAQVDPTTCSFAAPADVSQLNIGMVTTNGVGFCGVAGCIVPLDADPAHGVVIANGRVSLPKGACTNSHVQKIVYSQTCAPKPPTLPIAGAGAKCANAIEGGSNDGGGPRPIIVLEAGIPSPGTLFADSTNFYITSQHSDTSGGSLVLRIPKAGGPLTQVTPGVPGMNVTYAAALASDGANLYWLQGGNASLASAPITGGPEVVVRVGLYGDNQLFRENGLLYYTSVNSGVWSVPTDGGPPTNIVPQAYGTLTAATDGTSIYWLGPYHISKASLTPVGGDAGLTALVEQADGGPVPVTNTLYQNIAVDDASVYWVTFADGAIHSVPKNGGPAKVLATGLKNPNALYSDGTTLYFVEEAANPASLSKMPVGGGAPLLVVADKSLLIAAEVGATRPYFYVDDTYVYWLAPPGILKTPK